VLATEHQDRHPVRLFNREFQSQRERGQYLDEPAEKKALRFPERTPDSQEQSHSHALHRVQRVGRILRKSPGKDFSWIITLYAEDTTEQSRYAKELEKKLFGSVNIEYLKYSSGFSI